MRKLETSLEAGLPAEQVLDDLVYGWNNGGWLALHDYLMACVVEARRATGPILECGSGLTTLVVGAVARETGNELWSLEHLPEWRAKVSTELRRFKIGSVRLCDAPLVTYPGFTWYEPPLASMPEAFSLVVCDGPPAETPGGRYGLLPVMRDRLAPDAVILLDDLVRVDEQEVVNRWVSETNSWSQILGTRRQLARVTFNNRTLTTQMPALPPGPFAGQARKVASTDLAG
jgi:hypothetical protein